MKKEYDVCPTVETIHSIAKHLRYVADQLDRTASKLTETKDFTCAAQAVSEFMSLHANCRLDLLVTRPLREARND